MARDRIIRKNYREGTCEIVPSVYDGCTEGSLEMDAYRMGREAPEYIEYAVVDERNLEAAEAAFLIECFDRLVERIKARGGVKVEELRTILDRYTKDSNSA